MLFTGVEWWHGEEILVKKIKYFGYTGKINSKGVIAQHSDYFLYIIFLEKVMKEWT